MTELRALLWLSLSLVRRLLREGVVLRSLLSPPILLAGLIVVTLSLIAADQRLNRFAVDASLPDAVALAERLTEAGVNPVILEDAEGAVASGQVTSGTDGHTLWTHRPLPVHTSVEAVLRERAGASWRPLPRYVSATSPTVKTAGRTLVVLLTTLYAMYAVVFSAAAVVRDRDEGTLEVELALPIPTWVHAAARFLTAWAVVGAFYAYGLFVLAAVRSLPELSTLLLHGLGAVGTAAGVGLIAASSRAERGFSSVLALGLAGLTGLVGIGATYLPSQPYMPIVSVFSESSGVGILGVATLTGALGIVLFTRRSSP